MNIPKINPSKMKPPRGCCKTPKMKPFIGKGFQTYQNESPEMHLQIPNMIIPRGFVGFTNPLGPHEPPKTPGQFHKSHKTKLPNGL